jgi:hypothetical protein
MTWLAKAGTVLTHILGLITGFTPLIGQTFGSKAGHVAQVAGDKVTDLVGVITTAEAMIEAVKEPGVKSGPQKLKAAVPFVAKILLSSEALAGAKIRDEKAFNAAVTGITSNLADLLNSLEADSLHTHQA